MRRILLALLGILRVQLERGRPTGAKGAFDEGPSDVRGCVIARHSYGTFMTANLLAHSDSFAAGIARSGAYNRSLTPVGFQSRRIETTSDRR